MAQTREFRDWCWFLEQKTDSGQSWNKNYITVWNGFLKRIGFAKMKEMVEDISFGNVDYAVRVLESYEIWIQNKSWEQFKAGELRQAAHDRTPKSMAFDPIATLKRIQDETGLPRGPEAVAFARKWRIPLDE